MNGYKIELQIYAENEQEAEQGKQALIKFIDIMRQNGAAVRGNKLVDAVRRMEANKFVRNQIINFFRK